MDPIHDNTPLKNARNARNAIKLAAMLATKAMAVLAPLAAASITFLSLLQKKKCTTNLSNCHLESQEVVREERGWGRVGQALVHDNK